MVVATKMTERKKFPYGLKVCTGCQMAAKKTGKKICYVKKSMKKMGKKK
jgi:hypothetical protein